MASPQVLTSSRYDSRVVPLTYASIIVPTYREAPNIEPLVTRVFAAMTPTGIGVELIIVDDDSQDGTEQIVERLRERYPVRLVVRRGERGLSGAVLAGFREARFDRFVVLDGDLQHPPEMVPQLLARLDQGDCDFVIGTRYGRSGSVAADWSIVRRLGSAVATLLARPLARLSDPMSGFFALHRRTWEQAAPLDPIGYKIALELFVKGRCRQAAEMPIIFASRAAGASKASFAEGRRYLRHLWRLYRFRFPRLTEALRITVIVVAALFILICACRLASHPDARSTDSTRPSILHMEPTTHEP
ncbi:MAG: polyprenol monophosphomannose synthase [Planctomycetota bacterium]